MQSTGRGAAELGGQGAGAAGLSCTRPSVARWPDATITQRVKSRRVPKTSRFTTF